MVSSSDVKQAHDLIRDFVHRTPVLTSELVDDLASASLYFKCENFQKAGAFKARGAINAVRSLSDEAAAAGVATHSSGNHGAALSLAARSRGIPAYIVVPSNAKQVKKDAIAGYGATTIECEPTLQARESTLEQVVASTGAHVVHPYDDDRIIAGQGTAALELMAQAPELDDVVVPVGGGGLLAGTLLAFEGFETRVYGAEPSGADDAARSILQGSRVSTHLPDTICDGLLTTLGERNYRVIAEHVADIITVEDSETVNAMRLIWSRLKIVVEPSSAIALAAILKSTRLFKGRRIGVLLTGGNVDLASLPFQGAGQVR